MINLKFLRNNEKEFQNKIKTKDPNFPIEKLIALDKELLSLKKNLDDLLFKNNEIDVWVVSASPSILLLPALAHFNIEANIIGTNNTVKNGVIQNTLEGPLPMFEGKVECIKGLISGEPPIFGIGDSINDLPMLEYCDIKAVVDRQNDLTKKAEQEKWFII